MKTKQLFPFIFIIGLTFNFCSQENSCKNEIIPTYSLEDIYNCPNTAFQMNIELSNDFVMIRNQADFDS